MRIDFITCYFNPFNWKSRLENFKKFYSSLSEQTKNIHVVECLFDDQEPSLNLKRNYHIVRSQSLLWVKENLLNYLAARLPAGGFLAWVDCDILFENDKLVKSIKKSFKHYEFVQLFEDVHYLNKKGFLSYKQQSIGAADNPGEKFYNPGFGWVLPRKTFDKLGGLFEYGVFGIADAFMVHASLGLLESYVLHFDYHPEYKRLLISEGKRWLRRINRSVGAVDGSIKHLWHGSMLNRKYVEREVIVAECGFQPSDLRKNSDGLLEWCGNELLQGEIKRLLQDREEDD